jgi:hypothetical protein
MNSIVKIEKMFFLLLSLVFLFFAISKNGHDIDRYTVLACSSLIGLALIRIPPNNG